MLGIVMDIFGAIFEAFWNELRRAHEAKPPGTPEFLYRIYGDI